LRALEIYFAISIANINRIVLQSNLRFSVHADPPKNMSIILQLPDSNKGMSGNERNYESLSLRPQTSGLNHFSHAQLDTVFATHMG